MEQTDQLPQKSVSYYFLRSKDVHIENGSAFITFFARLTKEITFSKEGEMQTEIQTMWVEIDEVKQEQASQKDKALPNCMRRYEILPSVFYSLWKLSKDCPRELFYVTPYHRKSTCEKFIN
ncbi:hypothetical protein FQV26_08540 [Planococcus sp. CPCC 101016]|uniref:hypothetical protein n=1 Tax=Planococcus sp. CPCC 101016 TaxID=2599617 RepID=UPI0011B78035|nr:hypothetical protein [Planococcus sp. CPCC 101016]TWT07843.1 hypothetical protein FQV26_08540 [Planococcus sp. CPCC 101016]